MRAGKDIKQGLPYSRANVLLVLYFRRMSIPQYVLLIAGKVLKRGVQ